MLVAQAVKAAEFFLSCEYGKEEIDRIYEKYIKETQHSADGHARQRKDYHRQDHSPEA